MTGHLGEKYFFKVPGNKSGPDWHITMTFMKNGWYVEYGNVFGECVRSGYPYLFRILDKSWMETSCRLRVYVEILWNYINEEDKSQGDIQKLFDSLARWLTAVNEITPKGPPWEDV